MRKSGPTTAKAKAKAIVQPKPETLWVAICGTLTKRERHPADREHERADPERRIPFHQRCDRDGVGPPGRRSRDRQPVAEQAARKPAARTRGDQPDPGERHGGRDPERRTEPLEPDDRGDDPDEDGVVPRTRPTVEALVR